jgi:hypothetical protein
MGTKRHSMAKSFTAQVFCRKLSSRKSTRAVEESLLVVLALDIFELLRAEWRVGRSRLGVEKPGVPDRPLKRHFDLFFFCGLLHTCTDELHFMQDD